MIVVYNFNENDTSTFRDYSTNGRDGNWDTAPSIVNGDDGKAASFSGSEHGTAGTGYFDGLSNFSFYIKFKRDSGGSGQEYMVYNNNQMWVAYDHSNGRAEAYLEDANGNSVTLVQDFDDSNWHKLIGTFDGSTFTLYLDDRNGPSSSSTFNTSLASAANEFTFGAANTGSISNNFNGDIEDFRAFDKTLSNAEIDSLFNSNTGLTIESEDTHPFIEGDIITTDYDRVNVSAVVTLDVDDKTYKVIPIEGIVGNSVNWRRQGHCWDSSRQNSLIFREVSGETEMEYYDGVAKPSDLNDDSKRTHYVKRQAAHISYLKRADWYAWTNPNESNIGRYSAHLISNGQPQNDANLAFVMPRTMGVLDKVEVYMLTTVDVELSLDFKTHYHDVGQAYNANSNSKTVSITFTANNTKTEDITSLCEGAEGKIHGVRVVNNSDTDLYLLGIRVEYKT